MISLYRNEYTIYIMRMLFSLPLLSDISIFDVAMTPFYNVLCLDVFFGTPPCDFSLLWCCNAPTLQCLLLRHLLWHPPSETSHFPTLYKIILFIFCGASTLRHLIFDVAKPPLCDIFFLHFFFDALTPWHLIFWCCNARTLECLLFKCLLWHSPSVMSHFLMLQCPNYIMSSL